MTYSPLHWMLQWLVAAAGSRAVAVPLAVLWRCGGGSRSGRTAGAGVRALGTAQQVSGEALPSGSGRQGRWLRSTPR